MAVWELKETVVFMSVCDFNAKFENVKMQHVLNSYIS